MTDMTTKTNVELEREHMKRKLATQASVSGKAATLNPHKNRMEKAAAADAMQPEEVEAHVKVSEQEGADAHAPVEGVADAPAPAAEESAEAVPHKKPRKH